MLVLKRNWIRWHWNWLTALDIMYWPEGEKLKNDKAKLNEIYQSCGVTEQRIISSTSYLEHIVRLIIILPRLSPDVCTVLHFRQISATVIV
jgi:outer membrane protein assembly factor BamA